MKKTVLIISPFFSPNIGGVETHLDDLCSLLSEREIKTYVITYQPLTTKVKGKSLEQRGTVSIMRIKWFGHNLFHKLEKYALLEFIYLFPGIFLKSLFFTIRHRNEIAVIHAHGMLASFIAKLLGRLFKMKIMVSTHAIYNLALRPLFSRVIRYILSSFDDVLAVSEQSKKELMAIGIDAGKISVYTYWVNQDAFKPMDKRECKSKLGWQGKFVVLFVGRLLKIKGVELLLEAARALKDNIYIAFIGDGPLQEVLAREAQSNTKIIFVGKVDNRELTIYYNAADIVIVPSIYEEACGRIILEALSCGLAVIASARGGITEVLSKEAGILIDPTIEGIADAVNQVYQNQQMRNILGSRAREYAVKHFSKRNAEIIINSYGII